MEIHVSNISLCLYVFPLKDLSCIFKLMSAATAITGAATKT